MTMEKQEMGDKEEKYSRVSDTEGFNIGLNQAIKMALPLQ